MPEKDHETVMSDDEVEEAIKADAARAADELDEALQGVLASGWWTMLGGMASQN
jgi:hypothetical protein